MVLAACHIHSNWSYDGRLSLQDLAIKFSRRGYRVLLMTEHDRGFTVKRLEEYRQACADASSDKMLVLPGIEYSDAENVVHTLTWGEIAFLGEGLPTDILLREVTSRAGVAVFAHPTRRNAWQHFTPEWAQALSGVEVWNRKTDGWAPSRTAPLLQRNDNLLPFVGMDFHDDRQMFPLAMQISCSGTITAQTVLDALRLRRCQPMAFGHPLQESMNGCLGVGLRCVERVRKRLAAFYRNMNVTPHP